MATEKHDTLTRQHQIVQAAMRLIAERGLSGLSLGQVARAVGMVPSAIYRHYPDKQQMIEAVLSHARRRLLAEVSATRRQNADSLMRLEMLMHRHAVLLREEPALPRLLCFDPGLGAEDRALRQHLRRSVQAYLARIAALIEQAQQAGQIRAELNPGMTAMMFLGLAQPPALLWQLTEGRFDATRHAEHAWAFFHQAAAVRGQDDTGVEHFSTPA